MTTEAKVRTNLTQPEYFRRVMENSRRRWDQLEADPELAGPWRQLFSQVQSPRHVVSELLQNADDAGAKSASAYIDGDTFIFEHDGVDFDESTFSSLCRFGYSNKRNLHTIGFRGIGFKSTFSLGDSVTVTTPSLSFRFDRDRFTQPIWLTNAHFTERTRVAVRISTPERKRELEKNLAEWKRSGASLLFFRNIEALEISGERIVRRISAPGPFDCSEWIELGGSTPSKVLLIRSPEIEFPEDALREIKLERLADDLTIPPCSVEVVLGLPGEQRLHVVLPTGVRLPLPFSCNAPFLQDPARFAIKHPSTSATNRWLLARVGMLAAEAMKLWLQNDKLDIATAVAGYGLLPNPPKATFELAEECAKVISDQFKAIFDGEYILITTDNTIVVANGCIAPPPIVYAVWSSEQIKEVFGNQDSRVLAEEVSLSARQRLAAWGWLKVMDASPVLACLANGNPPAPSDHLKLLKLWKWVQEQHPYDYGGVKRRKLAIVPTISGKRLSGSDDVARLSSTSDSLRTEDQAFLSSLVTGIDRKWLAFLSRTDTSGEVSQKDIQAGVQLLYDVGLGAASPSDKVLSQAGRALGRRQDATREDAVRLAHVAATVNANVADDFPFVTRDGKFRTTTHRLMQDVAARVESLVPEEWADEHLLHDDYVSHFVSCTRQQWSDWVASGKSGLHSFAPISAQLRTTYARRDIEKFVKERGSILSGFPYVTGQFTIVDYDFDPLLIEHWSHSAKDDSNIWMKVVQLMVKDTQTDWDIRSQARIKQKARVEERFVLCDPIPAGWLVRLRRLKCLPNMYNVPHYPTELLMRTPETEPLLGVEPFVSADLDQAHTKSLLSLLGVRATPTDCDKLLGRIRDLATVRPVPIQEVARWLGALDRLVARSDAAQLSAIRQMFDDEALVLTKTEEWAHIGEVFRSAGEEVIPGLSVLHPSVADLPLWTSLGIADKPDDDLIVEWIAQLKTGQFLDGGERSRVRAFLTRCPLRIWNDTGHWLALDGTWTKVEDFRFHLTRRPDERINALFPRCKSAVADLSMVSHDTRHPAQSVTAELSNVIEYRLSDQSTPDPAHGEVRPWLLTLGQLLAHILLKDAEQQERVSGAAKRLARTVVHHQPDLRVIPYVENAPAGETVSVRALWTGMSLLVADCSPARYTEPLIDELSRPFGNSRVMDAIRVCIDRDAKYVEEYIRENFELCKIGSTSPSIPGAATSDVGGVDYAEPVDANGADEPVVTDTPSLDKRNSHDAATETEVAEEETDEVNADDQPVAAMGEQPNNDLNDDHLRNHNSYANSRSDSHPRVVTDTRQVRSEGTPRQPGGPTFVTEFAKTKHFVWNKAGTAYTRADGHSIRPVDRPFQWEWRDNEQNLVRRLWFAEQRLDKGIEIDTLVWEAIKTNLHNCSIVIIGDDGQPDCLSGETLVKMVEDKRLIIFPATYRLRSCS